MQFPGGRPSAQTGIEMKMVAQLAAQQLAAQQEAEAVLMEDPPLECLAGRAEPGEPHVGPRPALLPSPTRQNSSKHEDKKKKECSDRFN